MTPLVATAVDSISRINNPEEKIVNARSNPNSDFSSALLEEYDLDEFTPYIFDIRSMLQDAPMFIKRRGTKMGLKIALSWIGISNPSIVEEGFTYSIDPGFEPSTGDISRIIAISELSTPVRAKLTRIFHKEFEYIIEE